MWLGGAVELVRPSVRCGWLSVKWLGHGTGEGGPRLTAAVVVVVAESPDGSYTFTYIAQTAADVLTLSATKVGFEFPDIEIIAV